tara:strand:+ start:934 stop:1161 length:228 start_codon:yes stop_codon:yes gene_type:complete
MAWSKGKKSISKEVHQGGLRSIINIYADDLPIKESTDEIEHILWYPIIDDIYQKVIGHIAYKKQNGLIYSYHIWE